MVISISMKIGIFQNLQKKDGRSAPDLQEKPCPSFQWHVAIVSYSCS